MIYIHKTNSKVFHSIAETIKFEYLGECEITDDLSNQGLWVLFHDSFFHDIHKKINGDYIVVLSEPKHNINHKEYNDFINGAIDVWDYTSNFKLKFSESWQIQLENLKPIDVLFYGSINDRRENVLKKIPNIKIVDGYNFTDGESLWFDYILKSKIIISLSHYDESNNDLFRVAPLISNKCFVIAEKTIDSEFNDDLGIITCEKDRIPELCEFYLKNPYLRVSQINYSYDIFKNKKIKIPKIKNMTYEE